MTHEEPPDVDRRLRDAFRLDPRVVAKVVRAALEPEARVPLRWRLAAGAGAAVVAVSAALALWPHRPAQVPPEDMSLSGSFTNGVLVLPLPDGSVSISDDGTRESRPPDGYGIVLVEGELR